jgi:hypothetical protein
MAREKAYGGDPNALKDICASSQQGLAGLGTWQMPVGMTELDFGKKRTQMSATFEGAAGFCALKAHKYAEARDHLAKAVQADPADVHNMFQLGFADLEMRPLDKDGFWYVAKAANLSPEGRKQISAYGKSKYHKFHGGDDGWDQIWDQILTAAATQNAPGPEIAAIKPAPTPQELACQAVLQNDPSAMSFADWEFVLRYRDASPCNKDAANKVWAAIQAIQKNGEAKVRIPIKVISATADYIDAVITDDYQLDNKPDLHVVMEKRMTQPPAANSRIDIIGVFSNYTPTPFMFTMKKGEIATGR